MLHVCEVELHVREVELHVHVYEVELRVHVNSKQGKASSTCHVHKHSAIF